MPYELLAKGGIASGLLIVIAYLLRKDAADKIESDKYTRGFIDKIIKQNEKREEMLMTQLDKYNDSLQGNTKQLENISETLKVIPLMQKDIEQLKDKCKF